jgi:HlyD family secretion protein
LSQNSENPLTRKIGWIALGIVTLVLVWGIGVGGWFAPTEVVARRGAKVERGPLRISVLQRGELAAKNSVSLKSEIEGQTTILWLVPEGTLVKPGDLLVKLDASDLVEKELQQRIAADNADASQKKAKAQHDIQESQNLSDIEAAERKLSFAEMDLEKYLKGDLEQLLKQAQDKILLAQQKRTQAENTLNWSRTLTEKGFLTKTELDRDDLDFQSADVQAKQAELELRLFQDYEDPRKQSELKALLIEAQRGLERTKLQAEARIADFKAALSTSEARLTLESDKLGKYRSQLEKTKLSAPTDGMVVYARSEGGRSGSEAMQEGTQVREGQEILTIPRTGGMIAQASIHESVLKQVVPGMPCTITVDALSGAEYHGKVQFVALLPDKSNFWANPNQRLYRTEVSIEDSHTDMRPGMNCSIEILAEVIPDALYVPLQAVFLQAGETIAFVDAAVRPEQRSVKVGKSSEKWVQILSGLSAGEPVLLTPPPGFSLEAAHENKPLEAAPGAAAAPLAQDQGAAPASNEASGGERPNRSGANGERRRGPRGDGSASGRPQGGARDHSAADAKPAGDSELKPASDAESKPSDAADTKPSSDTEHKPGDAESKPADARAHASDEKPPSRG